MAYAPSTQPRPCQGRPCPTHLLGSNVQLGTSLRAPGLRRHRTSPWDRAHIPRLPSVRSGYSRCPGDTGTGLAVLCPEGSNGQLGRGWGASLDPQFLQTQSWTSLEQQPLQPSGKWQGPGLGPSTGEGGRGYPARGSGLGTENVLHGPTLGRWTTLFVVKEGAVGQGLFSWAPCLGMELVLHAETGSGR